MAVDKYGSGTAQTEPEIVVKKSEWNQLRTENATLKAELEREKEYSDLNIKQLTEELAALRSASEPLGEPFQSILDKHRWELYEGTAQPAQSEPVAWYSKNDITQEREVEWNKLKPIYEGDWKPLFSGAEHRQFCSEERPCTPCFTDLGPCDEAPQPAQSDKSKACKHQCEWQCTCNAMQGEKK